MDAETYQAAVESRISFSGTDDEAADELMNGIKKALNKYNPASGGETDSARL